MVHRRSQISDGAETQRDDHTDMVPVCQTVSMFHAEQMGCTR